VGILSVIQNFFYMLNIGVYPKYRTNIFLYIQKINLFSYSPDIYKVDIYLKL